jgi:hypothetical protein
VTVSHLGLQLVLHQPQSLRQQVHRLRHEVLLRDTKHTHVRQTRHSFHDTPVARTRTLVTISSSVRARASGTASRSSPLPNQREKVCAWHGQPGAGRRWVGCGSRVTCGAVLGVRWAAAACSPRCCRPAPGARPPPRRPCAGPLPGAAPRHGRRLPMPHLPLHTHTHTERRPRVRLRVSQSVERSALCRTQAESP